MRNKLRATWRLLFFAFGSLYYIFRYLVKALFVGNDLDRGLRLRHQWFNRLNDGINVHVEVLGEIPKDPGLIVSNHRSYYDPIVVLRNLLALPVGKAEVASWPIIGVGAKVSGAVFVERRTKEGRQKARQDILDLIERGYFVINYPEGTTHTNAQTIKFKPGMFKDAATLGFPVYPVALEYQQTADAWVGDDTFFRHFFECFGKKSTHIKLSYGPPFKSDNVEILMAETKAWIDSEMTRLRKNWHQEETEGNEKEVV